MPDAAVAQLSRLLHLIPALADGDDHLDAIAERIGTDRKTVLNDIAAISERYDDPGGFVEGVQIYVDSEMRISLVSTHFARPMRLTLAELAALELGLAVLTRGRPPEERPVIERARQRIRDVIRKLPPDWAPDRVRYVEMGGDSAVRHLHTLKKARLRRRRVRIAYRKPGVARAETRVVCPWSMAYARGRWYLIAHCDSADGVRIFRLDRIGSVQELEAGFDLPDQFDPRRYLADGRAFYAERPATLRVRYSKRIARWIAEREGKTPDADGSLTLDHPLADPDWAVRHVLQYGPDAEVLEPVEIRHAIRDRLRRLAEGGGSGRQ
ncbi:MAG TPA: WYL domain-containing protein [Gemmatimonadales bacterium]|nr:WYL domain-containing protein [Gemmatimonadales bacterium]